MQIIQTPERIYINGEGNILLCKKGQAAIEFKSRENCTPVSVEKFICLSFPEGRYKLVRVLKFTRVMWRNI